MDYAGGFPPKNLIHEQLSKLETGSEVSFVLGKDRIGIEDQENHCIGKLSLKASQRWEKMLDSIRTIKVLAMVRRNHNDSAEDFSNWIKAETWELPLLEVVFFDKPGNDKPSEKGDPHK